MNKEAIQKMVNSRVEAEDIEITAGAEKKDTGSKNITPEFIQDCLFASEMGDGILYSALHQDDYVFNKNTGEWYVWQGHYWKRDVLNKSLAAVEKVALKYLDESIRMKSKFH